jgi:uncharacterized protein (DUF2141 family)
LARIAAVIALAGLLPVAAASATDRLDIRPHEAAAVCGASTPQIEVTVTGLRTVGILTVELYEPSERDFLRKGSRLHRIRVPAKGPQQTVCFDIEAPGEYAVAAYHDLNANRKLDRKWNMLPAEPFALSKRGSLPLRMPVFQDAAFTAKGEQTRIELVLQKP